MPLVLCVLGRRWSEIWLHGLPSPCSKFYQEFFAVVVHHNLKRTHCIELEIAAENTFPSGMLGHRDPLVTQVWVAFLPRERDLTIHVTPDLKDHA